MEVTNFDGKKYFESYSCRTYLTRLETLNRRPPGKALAADWKVFENSSLEVDWEERTEGVSFGRTRSPSHSTLERWKGSPLQRRVVKVHVEVEGAARGEQIGFDESSTILST